MTRPSAWVLVLVLVLALGWLLLLPAPAMAQPVDGETQQGQIPPAASPAPTPAAELSDAELLQTGLKDLLNTVVVTATKREQPMSAAPAIMSVVTRQQIKERGYRSVADALQSVQGLYLITDHVESNLGVRGINGGMRAGSRIVKLMINGQPVSFRPTTANWLGEELIPIDAVERIEIIRGPSSALYGANAFLGVINIITLSGQAMNGVTLGGGIGAVSSHVAGGGSIVVGKRLERLGVLLAASLSYADRSGLTIGNLPGRNDFKPPFNTNQQDTNRPLSLYSVITYDDEKRGTLSLDLSYQRLYTHGEFLDWGPLVYGSQDPARADPNRMNQIDLFNFYGRARYSKTFRDKLSLTLSATYAEMGVGRQDHLAIDNLGIADYYTRDVGTRAMDLVGEATYTFRDVNLFTLGVDYTGDWHVLQTYYAHHLTPSISSEPVDGTITGNRLFSNVGAYLQSVFYPVTLFRARREREAPPWLGLTVGLRYDHHNIYGDVLNYKAGATVARKRFSIKLLYGTSFKAPASVLLYSNKLDPGGVINNPNLGPERAKTVEGYFGLNILPGLTASINGFFIRVDDKVEFLKNPAAGFTNVVADNVATVSSYGFEGSVDYSWRTLDSYLNVSFQRGDNTRVDPLTSQPRTVDLNLYPSTMLKFGVSYRLPPKVHLGGALEGRYISSVLCSDANAYKYDPLLQRPFALDGYFVLDVSLFSVGLSLVGGKETALQLKLQNLTGATYYYPGFGSYDVPALGRSVFLRVTQSL